MAIEQIRLGLGATVFGPVAIVIDEVAYRCCHRSGVSCDVEPLGRLQQDSMSKTGSRSNRAARPRCTSL